ncbi:Inorganic phosphate transporter pho84 [Lobosporangium transversale]|uniref:Major facilitator superfamily domain-containing protein n=1 Tax=Lobosporangium transversale TaxID=64571 RepID=A0A1Y2GUZ2_9FUNG|nr:major facilitator superfamily domain-containing protein [Lobosporangium transversale]KAF9908181.1 Inorganic phosphate transporter pho84 [Lobosporangium transversale]ORZ24874.1 major facilitator superfamily domain-containing protein [Lobosporangium transversale]|eukprot:XP_021883855.1 major facilitator superfamily domain-containing protein [Lobosporangium transversale]
MSAVEKSDDAGSIDQSVAQPKVSLSNLEEQSSWNWFTIRTLITSGTGFFTDAYDVFIINLIVPMLGYVYYKETNGHIPTGIEGALKGMASFGTLVGQLVFGYLGDACGRQKIYGLELMIIILGTFCCAMVGSNAKGATVISYLTFWRFILGIGIGGDYPMSATVTSEWASAGRRGQLMSIIFSMQGIGNMMASVVTLIVLAIFKSYIIEDVDYLDIVWRICIGVGCIPAVSTIYLRMTMPESPRYAMDVENDVEKANQAINRATANVALENNTISATEVIAQQTAIADAKAKRNHGRDFIEYFSAWENLKVLIGTSSTWFLLDIAFYGISLNQSYVLNAMGFVGDGTVYDNLWRTTLGNLTVSLLGFVPGYWFTVFLIEKMGRKRIQFMGFGMLTILFIILSVAFHKLKTIVPLFVAVFTLAQFFFNFGPNTTTFVVPGEVFPTRVRATAHGISAAAGKLGAILATFLFNKVAEIGGAPGEHAFLPQLLGIFAGVMALGFLCTFLIPETKGMSLEEIEERGTKRAATA